MDDNGVIIGVFTLTLQHECHRLHFRLYRVIRNRIKSTPLNASPSRLFELHLNTPESTLVIYYVNVLAYVLISVCLKAFTVPFIYPHKQIINSSINRISGSGRFNFEFRVE